MAEQLEVRTGDGRLLEVLVGGDQDGLRIEEILSDLVRLAGR